ncbi:MAG TPA: tetratricopeptide repeat protein [Candidatus Dormibacteraeota bacterium]|nr:tetratricopeptide repeat protein [Candidatus Dormibacteraeota bacterium]
MPEGKHFYEFGPFRLDPAERLLLRDGKAVSLTPKAFDTLLLLVENSGHLLKKDELMQRVWPETFVEEVNLAQNISAIRRALDDKNGGAHYVETVAKGGYRFTAETRKIVRESPRLGDQTPDPTTVPVPEPVRRRWSIAWLAVTASATILVIAAALFLIPRAVKFRAKATSAIPGAPSIHSIAVLPLVNLSSDPAQEYFSDGLTDELITKLAKIGSFQVISRTSVVGYKHSVKKVPEIGEELHVDSIVEGTIERVSNHVRIRVQLIRTSTDQHLWAESYDRELKDVLQLESDVAHEIAQQIGHVASEQPGRLARERPVSTEAHENYLKGRYRWNQRTESGLRAGIEHFQKAIELQPTYAQPYAGLADCYIMLANWGFMPGGEAYPKAEQAARKALEIDDQLAEAHTSLAYATFLYDWDWDGAEKKFRRAIELNPNYATTHHFYSIYLMAAGRQAEAQSEIKRAQELDPLSLIINSVVGWIYYEGRQYDQAIQQCEKTVEMDPSYAPALLDLGTIYLRTGKYEKAIAQFERARTVVGDKGVVLSYLAQARSLAGDKAEAQKILLRLERPSTPLFVSAWDFALIHLAFGDKEKALSFLEKAVDQHVGWVVRLGVDPALDSLRTEPRFRALQRRIRSPQTN